ncbi:hypothetical protein MRB53_022773 [Persea americana]|uniref:Uncharacterized protein n=1 Tax=Persea americana TaxID=3435 RepID=A0ACC2L848_PERAE|nr:hypothetical protein MRB53_022773 [Persea americana]
MIVCCRRIQRRRTELPLHVTGEGGSPPLPLCLDQRGREQKRGENSGDGLNRILRWIKVGCIRQDRALSI